jgi:hypothetical protein
MDAAASETLFNDDYVSVRGKHREKKKNTAKQGLTQDQARGQ